MSGKHVRSRGSNEPPLYTHVSNSRIFGSKVLKSEEDKFEQFSNNKDEAVEFSSNGEPIYLKAGRLGSNDYKQLNSVYPDEPLVTISIHSTNDLTQCQSTQMQKPTTTKNSR